MNLTDNEYFRMALYFMMGMLGGLAKITNDDCEMTFTKTFKVLFTSGFTAMMVGALLTELIPNISITMACFIGGISGVGGIMILHKIIDIGLEILSHYAYRHLEEDKHSQKTKEN